jgi:hypothetical protein
MNISRKLWQAEINRIMTQRLVMLKHLPPRRPPPWHVALWNRLNWRVREAREWLGEKIAGRSFEDY